MWARNDGKVLPFKKGSLSQKDTSDDEDQLYVANALGRADNNVRRLKKFARRQRVVLRSMTTKLSRTAKQRQTALVVARRLHDALRSSSSELGAAKAEFRGTTRRLSVLAGILSLTAAGYAANQLFLAL